MECLSAKTLSGRSFRNLTNRITMSAPLIYNSNSHSRPLQTRPSNTPHEDLLHHFPVPGLCFVSFLVSGFFSLSVFLCLNCCELNFLRAEKRVEAMTRDVGTQSTPPELSSSSLSPASTPPIIERSLNRCGIEGGDSPNSNAKLVFEEQVRCCKVFFFS